MPGTCFQRRGHGEGPPGDALVICGDDDRWKDKNAGREAAEECARAMNMVALFPAFANPAGKPTDWNDLCCADGVEEARRQLLSGERDTRHFLFRLDTRDSTPRPAILARRLRN
ncbi:MAG: hypothetical protein ACLSHC_08370 [Bilophila wadsworthia]